MSRPRTSFYVILIATPLVFASILIAGYCIYTSYHAKGRIDLRLDGDWPIVGDEVLGFSAVKNGSTTRRHSRSGLTYTLFTDGRGARVSARGEIVPNRVDILTVGGSYSWGHGLDNEETFTEMLGRRFNVRVANFAYGSYGTVQSLQLLERNEDLKPRVVIYGFITDHLRRNLSPCAPSYAPYCLPVSYVGFDEEGAPHIKKPVIEYYPRRGQDYFDYVARNSLGVDDILWGARAVVSRIKKKYLWNYSSDPQSRRSSMRALMQRMIKVAERLNALLVVVHIPRLARGRTESAPTELIDAIDQDTVFIDLSSAVVEYYSDSSRPLLRFELDGHPNGIAHELIAREIYTMLENKDIF